MEILSTGDKIRRARIYEGITLKELCEDKISISKMSCIENGKVKADEDTLRYIAKKLKVNYDYLVQDIREQIEENIKIIDKGNLPRKELLDLIKYILNYSIRCEYYDLA
ncbi:helix-turn-helix transcriptional regulator, partial [Clostridium saudiense]|nr:helix-turn-helix transcriptional regulator [Clostridium saudiense]